jgi:hypothetical protein
MSKNNPDPVVHHVLRTVARGRVTLFEAVKSDLAGFADLYFSHDTPLDAITAGKGATIVEARTLGGAPWLTVAWTDGDTFELLFDQEPVAVTPVEAELDLFSGRNAALAFRNGERGQIVADWYAYHHETHGMDAAVILSRGQPSDEAFLRDLRKALRKSKAKGQIVLVEVDAPLGRKDMPAESHPFCVPGAPGKDRMEIPPPDPWASPLAGTVLYEWSRARFLGKARAVANIDVYDLLVDQADMSVFDRAVQSANGYILLGGQPCYPWRARRPKAPEFGDHACVQFDSKSLRQRWCIAPGKVPAQGTWRTIRIGGVAPDTTCVPRFYRFMALRHPSESVSRIVPKSSLMECDPLLKMLPRHFDYKTILPPPEQLGPETNGRRAIITTMKNEGPFILEWIAYHRAIGFDDFLVYTNDCTDGTDTLLEILQQKGILEHRDNPFRAMDLKPQHAALAEGGEAPIIANADWVVCMDVDEYINIKCGDGTLDALFEAVGDVNLISMTWRLFGNSDIHDFDPGFITAQFDRCAPALARKPHQAWGFKTLYRNNGIFKKLGVHRPKGLKPQLWEEIRWVNGSGKPLPPEMYRNAWRSTTDSYGYDLVQLNHYAVRSAESFLVKRDRGRVNHVDRDQGLAYWFRMNNNSEQEQSIQRMLPRLQKEFDRLMQDPDIAAAHEHSVNAHRAKIDELKATSNYSAFFDELRSDRMEKLSRMHGFFGANVFLQGPNSVPEEIVARDISKPFFFTVEDGETEH